MVDFRTKLTGDKGERETSEVELVAILAAFIAGFHAAKSSRL